jgi:hypothetical protein
MRGCRVRPSRIFADCVLSLVDKLTKEEEEIYKLRHDLKKTVISQQQQIKQTTEVRSASLSI